MRINFYSALALTSAFSLLPVIIHADDGIKDSDVFNMSLQQLTDMDVTSVSKRTEKASQTAAALYVISQEDIRRSGYQNIPDLLRMVPGLQVAQSGSGNWAVTSRGFNSEFSNKLLVMIDGRTVYSPVFSGVTWDVQNVMLEDVDRIEVIRGPGATLWGANAVNGVINIITKNAKDTQGGVVTAATGTQERIGTSARWGGAEGDLSYRTYGQYFDYNAQHFSSNGNGAGDPWDNGQGGFRMDWNGSGKDTGTLQGDAYKGQENVTRVLPVTSNVSSSLVNIVEDTDDVSGMNVLGRWKHAFNSDSDITLQGYYDDVVRQSELAGESIHTQTMDLDFQHNWTANSWNNITWGLGYRRINSDAGNSFYISYAPEDYYENLYSAFIQDKIPLIQDKLFLTGGSKFEHDDFSGFEYEPSVRLSWLPSDSQTVWAGISRAVHTANQANQYGSIALQSSTPPNPPFPPGTPTLIAAEQGSPDVTAENLLAYEAGYRIMPREDLSFDITGFYNYYSDLASLSQGTGTLRFNPLVGAYVYVPLVTGNVNSGETHGVEFASTWEATSRVKFNASYTIYESHLDITGPSLVTENGTAPNQEYSARAYVDLTHNVQWDTMFYHVDELPALGIPSYNKLDIRLGWTPIKGLDLSLMGQNLLNSEHMEFTPFLYETQEQIGRSVLAKATFRF